MKVVAFFSAYKSKKADDQVCVSSKDKKCSTTKILVCLKCFTMLKGGGGGERDRCMKHAGQLWG